jgi:hypothetical protein
MRIDVPWGTGSIKVEVADERVAGVLGARVEAAQDPEAVLRAAITRPVAAWIRSWPTLPRRSSSW